MRGGELAQDRDDDDCAKYECAERAADHERQPMPRKSAELSTLGFDLAGDGDADQRDQDQRAGGGDSSATHAGLTA